MTRDAAVDINTDIEELNARHFVASEGGNVKIFTERYERVLKRFVLDRSSAADFRLLYMNRFVWDQIETRHGVQTKKVPLGHFWLSHHDRRQYRELIFDPTPGAKTDPDVFNLWRGFQIQPKKGDWTLWREHLLHIGSNGDPETFEFLLDWFAYLFRYPHRPAGTAIVWRGRQGSGKGTIPRAIGRILGQHFLPISNVKHLVGNFNAHLRDALLVFSDEAVWAGDKVAEGILKAMITEDTLMLEPKHRDVFSVMNMVHLVMATNNEWAAPVGVDDRRFCIVDVPDTHIGDEIYFRRLYEHFDKGALAAFLFDMLKRKVDRPPVTPRSVMALEAALTQKLHTMPPTWQWFYEKVESGQLLKAKPGWPEDVARTELHEDFLEFATQINLSRRASETLLGISLREMLPWIKSRLAPTSIFESDAKRARLWAIPPLDECRAHFAKALKMPGLFDLRPEDSEDL